MAKAILIDRQKTTASGEDKCCWGEYARTFIGDDAGEGTGRHLPCAPGRCHHDTVLTSVTGFVFPVHHFMPSHAIGIVSLIVLALAIYALYVKRLAGAWRGVYVIDAVIALYLNFFVLIAQLFAKVPALKALAPTQTRRRLNLRNSRRWWFSLCWAFLRRAGFGTRNYARPDSIGFAFAAGTVFRSCRNASRVRWRTAKQDGGVQKRRLLHRFSQARLWPQRGMSK